MAESLAADVMEHKLKAAQIFSDSSTSIKEKNKINGQLKTDNEEDIYTLMKTLEKLRKIELNKWLESESLQRYLEVGRVPRGLRILITSTYENPNLEMLKEWAAHHANLLEEITLVNEKIDKFDKKEKVDSLINQ
ncbi:hypothetical protein NDU88_007514 [Pleurodeles waltl]|uniref:Uncharacterized protein n=1 Tax=Pleurodeles waltl TaxID=8319 RepID=A0AAV7QL58_PLEWA|nr:hypothetical protein NDU88_007514 [Pleurodeles waltl]